MFMLYKNEYVDDTMALCAEVCFVLEYHFVIKFFNTIRKQFQTKFGNVWALHNTTIKCVVDHFHMEHTVDPMKHSGRARKVCTEEMKEVKYRITENLWLSVCKLATTVPLSQVYTHCLLHKMKLYQYHFSVKQEFKITAYPLTI